MLIVCEDSPTGKTSESKQFTSRESRGTKARARVFGILSAINGSGRVAWCRPGWTIIRMAHGWLVAWVFVWSATFARQGDWSGLICECRIWGFRSSAYWQLRICLKGQPVRPMSRYEASSIIAEADSSNAQEPDIFRSIILRKLKVQRVSASLQTLQTILFE